MAITDGDRPRAGRRRDPACDAAIASATVEAFVEEGYAGVSIEGVAARAGVGKATIYRRFATKAELLVAAIGACVLSDEELPDSGDVRHDLRVMLVALLERLRGPDGKLLVAFMAERLRHPDLAVEFERSVIGAKRAHARRLVREAVARGQLAADTDVELVAETGPAVLWHRAQHDLPLTDDLPDRILGLVLPVG